MISMFVSSHSTNDPNQKTEQKRDEEVALEEREALERAEKKRRRRMLGLDDSESEDGRKVKGNENMLGMTWKMISLMVRGMSGPGWEWA